jgi:hypothetical protein
MNRTLFCGQVAKRMKSDLPMCDIQIPGFQLFMWYSYLWLQDLRKCIQHERVSFGDIENILNRVEVDMISEIEQLCTEGVTEFSTCEAISKEVPFQWKGDMASKRSGGHRPQDDHMYTVCKKPTDRSKFEVEMPTKRIGSADILKYHAERKIGGVRCTADEITAKQISKSDVSLHAGKLRGFNSTTYMSLAKCRNSAGGSESNDGLQISEVRRVCYPADEMLAKRTSNALVHGRKKLSDFKLTADTSLTKCRNGAGDSESNDGRQISEVSGVRYPADELSVYRSGNADVYLNRAREIGGPRSTIDVTVAAGGSEFFGVSPSAGEMSNKRRSSCAAVEHCDRRSKVCSTADKVPIKVADASRFGGKKSELYSLAHMEMAKQSIVADIPESLGRRNFDKNYSTGDEIAAECSSVDYVHVYNGERKSNEVRSTADENHGKQSIDCSTFGGSMHKKATNRRKSCGVLGKLTPDKMAAKGKCAEVKRFDMAVDYRNSDRAEETLSDDDSDQDGKVEQALAVTSTSNIGRRRMRDKKFSCIYCSAKVSQLPRHLYSVHSDEVEVAQLLATSHASKKEALLTKLRNIGDHKNNLNSVVDRSGSLHVAYRPSVELEVDTSTYVPCPDCYGWYRREQLWRHAQRCKVAALKGSQSASRVRRPVRAADVLANSTSNEVVSMVLSGMRKGKVYMAISHDPMVHDLIRMLMTKVSNSAHHVNYVRGHVRNLGRVLLELKKNVKDLRSATVRDIISPRHFSVIVSAVKIITGFDTEDYAPSIGVNVGHDLNFCAEMVKTACHMEGDLAGASVAEQFETVMKSRWKYEVSGGERRELQNRRFNNLKLLPLTSDVKKLTSYLKEKQAHAFSVISSETGDAEFLSAFRELAETSLAQLILFNRRRQGEVSKLTIDIYTSNAHRSEALHPEIEDCLSSLEKGLCNLFTSIEMPGNRNRSVPLLLTAEMKSAMDNLVDETLRERADIASGNPYVFALSRGSMSYIRGHEILRVSSVECDASRPKLLRSTNLRKHVATMSQILNLKEHELDQLAQFMGHDVGIHRELYRLPNDIVQTAKVVRVLMSMENGTIGQMRGKSLDEIDVTDAISTC